MKTPVWLKPALLGACCGAAALFFIGFSLGGWKSASEAEQMAEERAHADVVAALLPFCVVNANTDPMSIQTLARMNDARSYERTRIVMDAGWATMPGADAPNSALATACVTALSS